MILVDHVTKRYGTTTVLDDVSLQIPKGGLTTLVGPNGAGKSTLLSIISRLNTMDSGRVTVDGLDVSTTKSAELATKLAILRQDNHIELRLTVADLVMFGRYPHSKGRPTAQDKVHIDRAIDYLDLDSLRHRYLDELSGGQRQRAFIAMVLAQDTDYVLLDEPLNNLDMKHSVEMMRLLRRTADELDRTIVVVLHDINFASCHSDQIIAMRDGQVAHQGSPNQVLQPAVLSDVFDLDIAVHELDGSRIGVYFS